ncbi:MAG TPA: SRPBCC family protein [Streptosporangiaceae bacterium]|nr:SRPBCC family protein [Streptosporangiaceae bacterium]
MNTHTDRMTSFTYTTYIHATPERVWQGLTDPAVTRRYWRHQRAGEKTFRSDWQIGSTYDMAHEEVGLVVSDPQQVILESDPGRRLAYTWHTFTPEWAAQVGMAEATADAWRAEPRSRVAFDIEDIGKGTVKLTVVHDGFESGSDVLEAISDGWPAVLSSLKTLLETGTTLPTS